jgi:hypothetical protein
MKDYRMSVDASVCFTLQAPNRKAARKRAAQIVRDCKDGLLVFTPTETHRVFAERLYVGPVNSIVIELESEAKP